MDQCLSSSMGKNKISSRKEVKKHALQRINQIKNPDQNLICWVKFKKGCQSTALFFKKITNNEEFKIGSLYNVDKGNKIYILVIIMNF